MGSDVWGDEKILERVQESRVFLVGGKVSL